MIYCIRVTGYLPYPIVREYTEKASDYSAAVSRALKKYRRDERMRGKRLDRVTVQLTAGIMSRVQAMI